MHENKVINAALYGRVFSEKIEYPKKFHKIMCPKDAKRKLN